MGWSLQPSEGTVSLLALVELAAVAGCPKIKGLAAVTQERRVRNRLWVEGGYC